MAAVNDTTAAFAAGESGLPTQEVQVDLTKLTALSPEVISKQATVRLALGWRGWQLVLRLLGRHARPDAPHAQRDSELT